MTSETLKYLHELLEAEKLDSALIEESEEFPYPRILMNLSRDTKNRDRVLEITAQEQITTEGMPQTMKAENLEGYTRIQFHVKFPFVGKDSTVVDLSSALLFINRLVELPGLELSEYSNQVYYRYVLMTSDGKLKKPLFLGIIGLILMLLDIFSETIEKIGDGSMTFNELLQQVIEVGKKS